MKDFEFLMWLHERLVKVHKENPLADYMHKLRAVILATPPEQDTPNVAVANNLDDVKAMLAKAPAPEATKHIPDIGKMVPLLCRARNALAGQGHMPFGEQGHEPGCSLCSAAELVDQAIHYAADTGKACDTCDREGEDGIHEHCEDYYTCRQGGASDYWKPKERSATT